MFSKLALSFFAFSAGFCGLAFEYTFSKFASDMLGNSPRQWAITIGLMFLAMGLGSDYQKKIADKVMLQRFYFFECLLSLIGGLGPLLMLSVFSLDRLHYMVVQYACVFFVGFVIGMEVPILIRLNQKNQAALSLNLATILRFDYLGGFLGAIVWAFFLLRFFPSMIEVALVLGLFNLTASLFVVLLSKDQWKTHLDSSKKLSRGKLGREIMTFFRWPKVVFISFFSAVVILVFAMIYSEKASLYFEQRLFRDLVIESKTSPFQRIVLTESKSGFLNGYINGQLQFSSIDEYIYHEVLVHPAMLMAKKKERVLILGGGDGLALREVLKYDQVKQVTLVDIDEVMIKLATENESLKRLNQNAFADVRVFKKVFSSKNSLEENLEQEVFWNDFSLFPVKSQAEENGFVDKVLVYTIDAKLFLEQIDKRYDVVILDFPDPQNIELAKLYSLSFYILLSKKLNEGAVITQQATSPMLTKDTFLIIGQTLRRAGFSILPLRAEVPSFGQWGFWLATHEGDKTYDDNSGAKKLEGSFILRDEHLRKKFLTLVDDQHLNYLPLRYLSGEMWNTVVSFPKNSLTFDKKKGEKKDVVNTLVNNIVWKTYLEESSKY